jgi:NADH-quinone oxidoreductase subunit E
MITVDYPKIDEILDSYQYDPTKVIAIMQDIQKIYRYLPQEALEYTAKKLNISEAKIFGVATFYENFSLESKGKYVIKVCAGTACHVRKSAKVLEAIFQETGLSKEKPTSDDGLFTIEVVSCLGACGLAPTMMVNDTTHSSMTPEKAVELIRSLREEASHEV